ncbi:hypothetical protein ACFW9L_39625 [Streptomyces sp. NPDC059517]|uniref:hypothetical protein n=1 Tax=Streptomyces sp. NPDC059517 TaxID=3346855 RepID=UPI00368135FC
MNGGITMHGHLPRTDVRETSIRSVCCSDEESRYRLGRIRKEPRFPVLFLLLLLLPFSAALTACSSDPPEPRPATSSVSGPLVTHPPGGDDSDPPAPAPAATNSDSEQVGEAVLPETLVGAWESDAEGGAGTNAYRFTADGRYKYAGLLFYPNTDGDDVQVTFVAEGTARVEDDELVLTPTTATRSLQDPADPAGSYTDQPSDLTPERQQWEMNGDVLALTDEEGIRIVYQRQSL